VAVTGCGGSDRVWGQCFEISLEMNVNEDECHPASPD
jgi:dihydroneopterin aldolase